MLRRFILVSGLVAASALGFAGSASAAEQDIQFGGTIGAGCSITGASSGTLVRNGAGSGLTSGGDGTSGQFTVNCSGASTVTVAAPVQNEQNMTATPPVNPTLTPNVSSTIRMTIDGTEQTSTNTGTGIVIPAAQANTDINGTVDMEAAVETGSLAAGEYTYVVTVTATPN